MRKFNYIIFDLDGTLLDTVPELQNNLNLTFRDLNLRGDFTTSEVMSFLGSGKAVQISRALKARNYEETLHFARVNDVLSAYYEKNTVTMTKPFPGVKNTLETLLKDGYKLFVATNKPQNIALPIVRHFFGSTFIFVRGDEGDGVTKPQNEFLASLVKKHGINLNETLYVGDSKIDYLTAVNLGVPCVLLSYGYDKPFLEEQAGSKFLINDFKELLKLL